MREVRRRLPQRLDLHARRCVARDIAVDLRALLALERVERVQGEELVELVAGQLSVHADPVTPVSTNESRNRRSPARMRLFTVPSGCSRISATSR